MFKLMMINTAKEFSTLEYNTARGARIAAQHWAKRGCKILAVQIISNN